MAQQPRQHKAYRALLLLYPSKHRKDYGEQMVQTFDDMLSEADGSYPKLDLWLRIIKELPMNIVEEHLNNLKGVGMSKIKSNKKLVGVGVFMVIVAGVIIGFTLKSNNFEPTTLAKIQNKSSNVACVQRQDNPNVNIDPKEGGFIANAAIISIIDVPAGTNVEVFLKSVDGTNASGSAIYPAKYGRYNFVAKKTAEISSDSFAGGWKVTRFEACK